nr:replication protein A 70 kDa DNA-binding subunit B-like [Ipomoea batatas]
MDLGCLLLTTNLHPNDVLVTSIQDIYLKKQLGEYWVAGSIVDVESLAEFLQEKGTQTSVQRRNSGKKQPRTSPRSSNGGRREEATAEASSTNGWKDDDGSSYGQRRLWESVEIRGRSSHERCPGAVTTDDERKLRLKRHQRTVGKTTAEAATADDDFGKGCAQTDEGGVREAIWDVQPNPTDIRGSDPNSRRLDWEKQSKIGFFRNYIRTTDLQSEQRVCWFGCLTLLGGVGDQALG